MIVDVGRAVVVERSTPMRGAVELVVEHPAADELRPGQFFQIAVGAPHAILRRPYSAAWHDSVSGRIGFIFNVVGAGSTWLANRHEGHELDLLGPFGRGFDLNKSEQPAIVVAGGLGVAVFPGVVKALRARGRPVTVLMGARTADQLLPGDRFSGAEVKVATDDGSQGHRGSVVDLLDVLPPPLRARVREGGCDLFACGPTPMLQALVDVARRFQLPLSAIQVALETPMGCGMGTCLGCAAPASEGGYLLTCQDGPCVQADRLDWARMTDAFHE